MSAGGDGAHESSHGGHGESDPMAWMAQHLGGLITPFGKRAETLLQKSLVLIVNGVPQKVGRVLLFVFSPILLIEFVLHYLPV